jgi:crotonobetainyl-CoA:carnitine CoA-transferase CaiB-like acyl-CoA transferase
MTQTDLPALHGVRVLDLATPRCELAGRTLAELGAEVLKLEPPEGAAARLLPPFDDATGASLYWAALGMGKRSAVVDVKTLQGQETVRRLAERADVLIESWGSGGLQSLGLGYAALSAINPRLIYASASPFGLEGPKAAWPATDLTLEAMSGRLGLQGDFDRQPLPVGYPQASFHVGARLAADIVIALNERELSGLGQHLDASMLEAMTLTLMNGTGYPHYTGGDPPGFGDDRGQPPAGRGAAMLGRSECADGFVIVTPTSNANVVKSLPATVLPELREQGLAPKGLDGIDWDAWGAAFRAGEASDAEVAAAFDAVRAFFRLHTKAELMRWAWEADVHLGPVNTPADLLSNPHFEAKGYWRKVGPYVHPGPSIDMSRTPLCFGREAPALGAEQRFMEEWLSGAGDDAIKPSPSKGEGWERARAPRAGEAIERVQTPRLGEAFAGLKVLDLGWVAVGPITSKALADHGAHVVRVESSTRVDYVRTLQPFKDGVVGINRSHFMNNLNTSKLGVALNFATKEGRELLHRLARWADVIVENYTPGTMRRLGIDYESLSKEKPELIVLSTSLLGSSGPWSSFAGYGPHGSGISGLYGLTGWPDRAPSGPNGPYTDVIAPHYTVAALAAAIFERRRSGRGQHVDVSQVESAIHFIEPLVLDYTVNGRVAGPQGLDSATACPHGVYPALGTERYVAIACETAAQWRALCGIAPLDEFNDAKYEDLQARLDVRERIDAALAAWTRGLERYEVERRCIDAGVPAAVVQRMTEVVADPQLAARDYFQVLDHGEIGPTPFDGLMTRFSAKRRMLHKGPPCVGEDTERVMREVLGLTDDEIADYAASGVFV